MTTNYVKAMFAVNDDPAFEGYYVENTGHNGFLSPAFKLTVACQIADYYNSTEPGMFRWDNELLWYTDLGNESPEVVGFSPLSCLIDNELYYTWNICPDWTWQLADSDTTPYAISTGFLTQIPDSIDSIDEAKVYLKALYDNGEAYHPEDSAQDCFSADKRPSYLQCMQMNKLMSRVYELAKGTDFDPCGYLLELDPEYVAMRDADIAEHDELVRDRTPEEEKQLSDFIANNPHEPLPF